jgi:hypothetical protein
MDVLAGLFRSDAFWDFGCDNNSRGYHPEVTRATISRGGDLIDLSEQ